MNAGHIEPVFRVGLILGAILFLFVILWMLKKKKLTVRYSIVWFFAAFALVLFAVFPYIVLVLRDLLQVELVSNLVFLMVLAFVLFMLLSISCIVSVFSEKLKRLSQESALLEQRVRELERQLDGTGRESAPRGARGGGA